MGTSKARGRPHPSLRQRLIFLIVYGIGLYFAARFTIGSWRPTGGGEWLWWLSAVTLYVTATLATPFFVRPRDALANAIASAAMLFTIDLTTVAHLRSELMLFRQVTFLLAVATGVLAAVSIYLHEFRGQRSKVRRGFARFTYDLSVPLGSEAVMFTPPALLSIVGFYQDRPLAMLWLTAIWIFIVATKPVELLIRLWLVIQSWWKKGPHADLVGEIVRIDDPGLVRVALRAPKTWTSDRLHSACLPGARHVDVVPLFVQTQEDALLGTGLFVDGPLCKHVKEGEVWTESEGRDAADVLRTIADSSEPTELIGFVIEQSTISTLQIEVAHIEALDEGSVVFVREAGQTVYYQILDAATKEEVFTQNPRGTRVLVASQLGILDNLRGFTKHGCVPCMNTPVFMPSGSLSPGPATPRDTDDFVLGTIANAGLTVRAGLSDMVTYHTAVLGVTGTGKTELVFDLIRAHVAAGRKVFCVDFTGEYKPRLSDLSPESLNLAPSDAAALERAVEGIEYAGMKVAEAKQAMDQLVGKLRAKVAEQVTAFIEKGQSAVGIFELPEIANTRATLRATELYLSAVFEWARRNRRAKQIVIVLEEAHTVIPEAVMFGYDKGETHAVVGRMAQIALQGRKYGVGLLLVSQRTALVSKTLLSQCNTCICFAMYDKTGLEYLSSVFASEHVRAIPNLRFLQAIAFGKAVKSDRPVIFEIAEDQRKRDASEALSKRLDSQAAGEAATSDKADTTAGRAVESAEDEDITF